MKFATRVGLVLATCIATATISRAACAHPAGFTSVNRYVGVECDTAGRLRIAYLLDFAEMPSRAELESLDGDHDGTVSPAEQRAYLDRRIPPLVDEWTVEVDGAPATPRVTGSSLEILEGERGLPTVRIAADVTVDVPGQPDPVAQDLRVHVIDPVFAERSGWREMSADDASGWVVTSGPTGDPSKALAYAAGGGPPRVDEAWFSFHRAGSGPASVPAARTVAPASVDPRLARLSRALRDESATGSFSILALGLAAALGAVHALSPGHGKALAAAYLAGSRARAWQAALFGATVTAAHTAVVFAVGCLAVAVERTVGSDRLMRGLELAAALTVVVLGAMQLSKQWRHLAQHGADHAHVAVYGGGSGVRGLVALGASAGLTPCPSALALLLMAVALHKYALGLVLVLAFSAGLACTLTAVGLLVVLARRLIDRATFLGPVLRWLPLVSSGCVLAIGVVLCAGLLS
jgi:nickel/cobalt exporter